MNTILKADSTFDSSAHKLVYVKLYINQTIHSESSFLFSAGFDDLSVICPFATA